MIHSPLYVLLVDDDASLRKPLAGHLRKKFSYHVVEAATFDEAIAAVEAAERSFDVALLDDMLIRSANDEPAKLGMALMHAIRNRSPYTEFILFTGWGLKKDWEAIEQGAFRFLSKSSFDPYEVGHLVRQAAEFGRLKTTAQEKQILEQLMKTGPLLSGDARLEKVLNDILNAIHAIGFDRVRLYLLSDDRQQLIGQAHIGMSSDFIDSLTLVEDHPNMQSILDDPRPIFANRVSGERIPFAHDDNLAQWACVPLKVQDEVIGKLSVDNGSSQRPITETELRPVAIFADQAATAIQTARLRQKQQDRQHKLDSVRQVSESLNDNLSLPETLDILCRAVVEIFKVDHSAFVIFDEDYRYGQVAAEYPPEVSVGNHRVQLEGIPAQQRMIQTQEPMVVHDVATYKPLGVVRGLLGNFDIQSVMIVPAVFQGKALGSFSLDAIGRRRTFTKDEIELCQILAAQAGTAIDNAQVYENTRRLVADSPVAIIANDNEGKIIDFNKRAEAILGYSREKIMGQHVTTLYFLPEEPQNIGDRLRASADGRLSNYETSLRTKSGQLIPVRMSVSWLHDGLGEHRGALGYFEDITYLDVQKRLLSQSILHQSITDAIQSADDIDEAFYLILTAITAGFGLGFNRAALFIRDIEQNKLVGARGIGYLDPDENQKVWNEIGEQNLNNIKDFREQLKKHKFPHTPIGENIAGFELPIEVNNQDIFSDIVASGHWQHLESEEDIQRLPKAFRERFEPQMPLIITTLRSKGEVIGLLVADNKFSRGPIEYDTIQSLITLANTAAIAISKAQLLAKTRQQAKQLAKVSREATKLAQAEGQALLQEIIQRSMDLLGARSGGIYEYDSEQEKLTVIAEYSDRHPSIVSRTLRLGEGMAGKMVQSGRAYMIENNYAKWDGRAKAYDNERSFGSVLEVLLKWRDDVVGVLFIEDAVGREFSADDARLLLMFADHAAIALKNATLHAEDQLAWQRLRDSFEASITLAVVTNPKGVLETAIHRAHEVNGALNAGIILLDSQNRATALYFTGEDWQQDVGDIVRRNEGVSVQVKKTGKPFICENTDDEPDINPIMREKRAKAAVCLPFAIRKERIGVMWVHYEQPRSFSEAEIAALKLYAAQAAIAYDQARRIETLQHMREAAESLSSTDNVEAVLLQIVKSACTVLHARSAAILSYDDIRDQFVSNESVAIGFETWDEVRRDPQPGQTTYTVMDSEEVVEVEDVNDEVLYDFLGEGTRRFLQQNGVGSFLGVKLSVGGEKLGVLYVNYESPRDFSKEERQNVDTFANHAAVALKKARLLDKVQHAYNTAKLIARLSVDQGLNTTLTAVVEGAVEVLSCDAIVLYPYDQEYQQFEIPRMEGVKNQGPVLRYEHIPHDSIVFDMMTQPNPYIVSDAENHPLFKDTRFRDAEGIKSLVAIPLLIKEEPVGVMFINYRHKRTLVGEEIANIQLFADQAAVAIHDARLYESERKRVGTLEALQHAGEAVMGSLDLYAVLDTIAEQAWLLACNQNKKALFCSMLLVENGMGEIVSAYPHKKLKQIHQKLGKNIDWQKGINGRYGITGRAYRTGSNQRVPDVRKDRDFLVSLEETRSAMAICIKSKGEITGFIVVEHEEVGAFTERDERTIGGLAAQAAVAIKNAQDVKEIQRIKGFVGSHNAIKWMEMVSLGWGHNIKRAIGEVKGHAHLLRNQLVRGDNQAALTKLTDLEEAVSEISQIPLTEPLTSEKAIKSLPIDQELTDYFTRRWQKARYREKRGIDLQLLLSPDVGTNGTIRASRAWFRQLCEILSDNAVEAMVRAQTPDGQFVVKTQRQAEWIKIVFEDNGPGIPDVIQSQLFRDRVIKKRGEKGAGIGLMQADAIVQTYGGEIVHDAAYTNGTRFSIRLPSKQGEEK